MSPESLVNHIPSISIIIANWNGRHWLETCLPALAAQTYPAFEIIIVDNGSTDGSTEWLREYHPHVRLIANTENRGFAPANNQGFRAADPRSEYLVALNNDTRPEATWLAELVGGVNAPDIGMVASQVILWQEANRLDAAGISVNVGGMAWNRGWQQPIPDTTEPEEVFGPNGAAALYRRSMLDEIGLFDEDYFAYYEDVDLAWRARRAGWRCLYVPTARVLHHHSATGAKLSHYKAYLLTRNRWWTILKNYDRRGLWLWPLILLYDAASLVSQTWQTRSLIGLKARWDVLRSLRSTLAKRHPGRSRPPLEWPGFLTQR